jgi:HK97 family phage portal protein
MGFFDFLKPQSAGAVRPMAAAASQVTTIDINNSADLDRFLRSGGQDSFSGEQINTETAMRTAAVYGCVRIITGATANLPLHVYRRVNDNTREKDNQHPLWNVLRRRPNPYQKPTIFRRYMQTCLLLRGNAYARIVRGVGGKIIQLIPLNPDRVKVDQKANLELEFTYKREDGNEVVYNQNDVFHLVGMTLDGIRGVSVIEYAKHSIGLSIATQRHGSQFFKNGTKVGSVLKHPNQIGKEGFDFLKSSLDSYRSDKAGGTLILEEGADFQNLGMSAEDAQFVETMKLSRTDIAMFFGVPPHMLGDTEKSTSWGTGIEQQGIGFVTYTLEDWLTCWEDAFNTDLVRDDEQETYVQFNRNALTRGDISTRYQAYATGLQWGFISPNEVRALENLNPRDDGDRYYEPPNTSGNTPN